MSEPLWSNERIGASLVALANDDGELTADDIMYLIYGMRDEYEAKLDVLRSANDRLAAYVVEKAGQRP